MDLQAQCGMRGMIAALQTNEMNCLCSVVRLRAPLKSFSYFRPEVTACGLSGYQHCHAAIGKLGLVRALARGKLDPWFWIDALARCAALPNALQGQRQLGLISHSPADG